MKAEPEVGKPGLAACQTETGKNHVNVSNLSREYAVTNKPDRKSELLDGVLQDKRGIPRNRKCTRSTK